MYHYDLGVGVHLLQGTAKLDPPATINPKADHLSFTADNLQVVEERLQELGVDYICDRCDCRCSSWCCVFKPFAYLLLAVRKTLICYLGWAAVISAAWRSAGKV